MIRDTVLLAMRVVLLMLVVAGCGAASVPGTHSPTEGPSLRSVPPPASVYQGFVGTVDVGDHALFLRCLGRGTPTIVMESSVGKSETAWFSVWPELIDDLTVCMYDRAGVGQSELAAVPRTAEQSVQELHTLLARAHIAAPFVLVGHSWGGMLARLYATRYPEEIIGLVLVNSVHPDQFQRLAALLPPAAPGECAALGMLRAGPGENAEGIDFDQSAAQVRAAGSLGDLPLVVLTVEQQTHLPSCVPQDLPERMDQAWEAMQWELARLSTNSLVQVVGQRGHNLPDDQPRAVADAIRLVIAAGRSGQRLEAQLGAGRER